MDDVVEPCRALKRGGSLSLLTAQTSFTYCQLQSRIPTSSFESLAIPFKGMR